MGLCEVQVPSVPKDPVRLIEKAYDDYFTRFSDSDKVSSTSFVGSNNGEASTSSLRR